MQNRVGILSELLVERVEPGHVRRIHRLGITAFTVGWRCTGRALCCEPLHAYFPMSGAAARHMMRS
jgi:hypothetical protein